MMQVYSGEIFDYSDPVFAIRDIAESLDKQCRYLGHCKRFYSVLEHSVYVTRLLVEDLPNPDDHGGIDTVIKAGLLHDAAEAYFGDIITPLRHMCPQLIEARDDLQDKIYKHFGCIRTLGLQAYTHRADLVARATERRDLLNPCTGDDRAWGTLPEPSNIRLGEGANGSLVDAFVACVENPRLFLVVMGLE